MCKMTLIFFFPQKAPYSFSTPTLAIFFLTESVHTKKESRMNFSSRYLIFIIPTKRADLFHYNQRMGQKLYNDVYLFIHRAKTIHQWRIRTFYPFSVAIPCSWDEWWDSMVTVESPHCVASAASYLACQV